MRLGSYALRRLGEGVVKPPHIEVWALPKGGWNVVVLDSKRLLAVSGPCPTSRSVRNALDWAAQLRRTLAEQRRQYAADS